MTDKNIDQLIEKTMKQAVLPESVQKRLEKTAEELRTSTHKDSDGEKAILFHSRKKRLEEGIAGRLPVLRQLLWPAAASLFFRGKALSIPC